jgi:hypothetical protein
LFGPKLEPNSQITAKLHSMVNIAVWVWYRTSQFHRLRALQYGVIRYGTVFTIKIALVRRSRTSLFF